MPNEEMIQYWNKEGGPRWIAALSRLDAQIAHLAAGLLAEVERGETVLDVGCGCAPTTLELAERVGPTGRVVGIDIARPMLEHARKTAQERGARNVEFVAADAQTHALPEQAFDRVFSRFGVMFFDDPVAAFSNIRQSMRRGARLGLLCWQNKEKNDWMRVPFQAIASVLEVPPAPAADAPGPFSLGDRERLHSLLSAAGFENIDIESQVCPVTIGGAPGLDNAVEHTRSMGMISSLLARADPGVVPRVEAAIRRAYEPYDTPEGVKLGSASWLVRATA